MGIFKKKDKTQTPEYKEQAKALAEDAPTEEIIVGKDVPAQQQATEVPGISLEEAIATSPDAFYKAQVLSLLMDIKDQLRLINENLRH